MICGRSTQRDKGQRALTVSYVVGAWAEARRADISSSTPEVKPDQELQVTDEVAEVLKEFSNVMPLEVAKHLPPGRQLTTR